MISSSCFLLSARAVNAIYEPNIEIIYSISIDIMIYFMCMVKKYVIYLLQITYKYYILSQSGRFSALSADFKPKFELILSGLMEIVYIRV